MAETMGGFADKYEIDIEQFKGRGEFLGADTREAARDVYRAVIEAYEKSHSRRYRRKSQQSLSNHRHAQTLDRFRKEGWEERGLFAELRAFMQSWLRKAEGWKNVPRDDLPLEQVRHRHQTLTRLRYCYLRDITLVTSAVSASLTESAAQ